MSVRSSAPATLTEVLHEAHAMRDEALGLLVLNAWHGIGRSFSWLIHAPMRIKAPAHLAK